MDSVLRPEDSGYIAGTTAQLLADAQATCIEEWTRPSVVWRPQLSIDGNKWCALYGNNLQDGVVGFGDSPDAAMRDFDKSWHMPIKKEG